MGADDREPRPNKKKIRVDLRRNIGKVVRDKRNWARGLTEDAAQHDTAGTESLRKSAKTRRRTVVVSDTDVEPADNASLRAGTVLAVRGLIAAVDLDGVAWNCTVRRVLWARMKSTRQPLAVGDRVRVQPQDEARRDGVISQVEPRRTTLTRQYEDRVQVLAANVDQVLVVAAADMPTLRPHLIDRFLVAAHKGGLRPIILINKIDLRSDEFIEDVLARYAAIGYTVLPLSVKLRAGLDEVAALMKDQTSVVAGISGVGKSSLLNAIDPALALPVGDVGESTRRGRHTTTVAELRRLSFGGYVVDTPGMRQFELAHVSGAELEAYFTEFRAYMGQCKYHGCTHLDEVGCAIRAAAEAGTIHPERYDSYARMMRERRAAGWARHE